MVADPPAGDKPETRPPANDTEDAIKAFIRERGVTVCPPAVAYGSRSATFRGRPGYYRKPKME